MSFLLSLADIYIVILLLRLLIKTNEVYSSPLYRLLYRITDPVIKLFSALSRNLIRQGLLAVLVLVLLRGLMYGFAGGMPPGMGMGRSFIELFQLLFQGYGVLWVVGVLSQWSFGGHPFPFLERAFHPLNRLSQRFGISRSRYPLFQLLILFGGYSILTGIVRLLFLEQKTFAVFFPYGLLEALMLALNLFPFPGFFSVIILVGALLSWVSPDPSNPVVRAIYGISEPLLAPFRRIIPLIAGLDLSPLLALLCFQIVGSLGQQLILQLMRG